MSEAGRLIKYNTHNDGRQNLDSDFPTFTTDDEKLPSGRGCDKRYFSWVSDERELCVHG